MPLYDPLTGRQIIDASVSVEVRGALLGHRIRFQAHDEFAVLPHPDRADAERQPCGLDQDLEIATRLDYLERRLRSAVADAVSTAVNELRRQHGLEPKGASDQWQPNRTQPPQGPPAAQPAKPSPSG